VRRAQQNHMQHMEAAATEMQALQVHMLQCTPARMLTSSLLTHSLLLRAYCCLKDSCKPTGPPQNLSSLLNDSVVQDRCSELEEQQGRLEGHIRVTEQHCAATQGSVDVLQQANVHLRQQLETSEGAILKQVRSPDCGRTSALSGYLHAS